MKYIVVYGIILVSAVSSSCRNKITTTKSYWEIEDSIKQAEEDSVKRCLKQKRQSIESKENINDTIWGNIRFGFTNKEYNNALNNIEKSIGYRGVSFGNITLFAENAQFYKGKLYSLDFGHTYYYKPYRASYNSTPYFNPESYIMPIISHFEKKYGLYDYKDDYEHEIRGRERAVDFKEVWIFKSKRITITNEADQYSDDPECACYKLKITIDNYPVSQEIENLKEKVREADEKKAEQKEQERQKREKELLKTL